MTPKTFLTPTEKVFSFKGSPNHRFLTTVHQETGCARCQTRIIMEGLGVPVSKVLSEKFTEWDKLVNSKFFCPPCAWAYSTLENRLTRYLITPTNVYNIENNLEAYEILVNNLDLAQQSAISLPTSGNKHVLPYTRFGKITTDTGSLKYDANVRNQLMACSFLRENGVPENHLFSKTFSLPENIHLVKAMNAWETVQNIPSSTLTLLLTLGRVLGRSRLASDYNTSS